MSRFLNLSSLLLSVSILATTPVLAAAGAEDSCKDVLVYAARNYMTRFSLDERKAWVYSQKCGASTNSSSAGIDVLVEAVPIGVSMSSSNQRQWCEDNRKSESYLSIVESMDSTISVPAVQNWASCMEAESRRLKTRIRTTPGEETIQVLLTNQSPNEERLVNVFVHSSEGAGIACSPSPSPDSPDGLKVNREYMVNCTRSPIAINRKGTDYQILPGGSITTVTTLGSYLYSFPERFIDKAVPATMPPQRQVLSLNGMHVGTKAYWSGGTASQLLRCGTIERPAPNFDLIEISMREERVQGLGNSRGLCGVAPYCDSAGEFCAEVYYSKACFVNREWHEWYKSQGLLNKIPYSEESVCGS